MMWYKEYDKYFLHTLSMKGVTFYQQNSHNFSIDWRNRAPNKMSLTAQSKSLECTAF